MRLSAIITGDIEASMILKDEPAEFLEKLKQWVSFSKLHLCYRATADGWLGTIFHLQCGNTGRTITLIKVQNYIFGGYSTSSWGSKYFILNSFNQYKYIAGFWITHRTFVLLDV